MPYNPVREALFPGEWKTPVEMGEESRARQQEQWKTPWEVAGVPTPGGLSQEEEVRQIYKTTAEGSAERNKRLAEMVQRRGLMRGISPSEQAETISQEQQSVMGPREEFTPSGEVTGPTGIKYLPAESFQVPSELMGERPVGSFIEPQQQQIGGRATFGMGGLGTGKLGVLQREFREAGAGRRGLLEEQPELAEKTYQQRLEAAKIGEQAAVQQAVGERVLAEERQENWDKLQAQRVQAEASRQQQVADETDKLKASMADFQQMSVEPKRMFKNADGSTNYPKAIGAAIAVGLGALGASLPRRMGGTGGPNMALQIVQRAIDRDIDAQKSDIAQKRMGVGMQQNLLGQMKDQFTDERQAEAATRIHMLQTYEMELDKMAAAAKAPQIQAKFLNMKADIQDDRNKLIYTFKDAAYQNAQQAAAGEFGMEEQRLGARARSMQMEMAARAKAMAAQGQAPPGMRQIGGTNKTRTDKAVEYVSEYNVLDGLLDRAIYLRSTVSGGPKLWPSDLKAEMQALSADLKLELATFKKRGANFSESEQEMIDQLTGGDITDFGFIESRLTSLRGRAAGAINARIKPYGWAVEVSPTRFKSARKAE
jgi:hypothetical protein